MSQNYDDVNLPEKERDWERLYSCDGGWNISLGSGPRQFLLAFYLSVLSLTPPLGVKMAQ